jgi:hypothetical protein
MRLPIWAGGDTHRPEERRLIPAHNVVGISVRVAALDDLIRMKRAAGGPQDRIAVEWLSALRDEFDG